MLTEDTYNLTLNKRETPIPQGVIDAKFRPLQDDQFNCGFISLFEAAILAALQPTSDKSFEEFKRIGIPLIKETTGIELLTREDFTEDGSEG